jgi:hypothetical protein
LRQVCQRLASSCHNEYLTMCCTRRHVAAACRLCMQAADECTLRSVLCEGLHLSARGLGRGSIVCPPVHATADGCAAILLCSFLGIVSDGSKKASK